MIIRSHEGPDARADREDMGNMLSGYSIDHEVESGKLCTVFSASMFSQVISLGTFTTNRVQMLHILLLFQLVFLVIFAIRVQETMKMKAHMRFLSLPTSQSPYLFLTQSKMSQG